jgi:hypothetical protein
VVEPEPHHAFATGTLLFGSLSGVVHHPFEPNRSALRVLRFTKMRPSLRLGLGIQLAAATLTQPDRVWDASLVCRAPSVKAEKRGTPEAYAVTTRLHLIGDTPDERIDAARRLLAMAAEMAHQSFNRVVPYLDRCSHAVATKKSASATDGEFRSDTAYDVYVKRFWNETDPRDFARLTADTAAFVWDTYAACVKEVQP